jgi:hypothetical protein
MSSKLFPSAFKDEKEWKDYQIQLARAKRLGLVIEPGISARIEHLCLVLTECVKVTKPGTKLQRRILDALSPSENEWPMKRHYGL